MEKFNINDIDLDKLKNVDLKTIDKNNLVDINDVKIDTSLPVNERIVDYIRQIKNPYVFKCGKLVVKVNFANTNETLEDKLKHIIDTL